MRFSSTVTDIGKFKCEVFHATFGPSLVGIRTAIELTGPPYFNVQAGNESNARGDFILACLKYCLTRPFYDKDGV